MSPIMNPPPIDPPVLPPLDHTGSALFLLSDELVRSLATNPTLTLQIRQADVAVCAANISAQSIDAILALNPTIVLLGYFDSFALPGWGVGSPFWDTVRMNLAGCRYAGNLVPQDYPVPSDAEHCPQLAIRPAPKNAVKVVQVYHAVMDRRLGLYADQLFAVEPQRYVDFFGPAWAAGENLPAPTVEASYREARASYCRTLAIYASAMRRPIYANIGGAPVSGGPRVDALCIEGTTLSQRSLLSIALDAGCVVAWDLPPAQAVPGLLLSGIRL